MGAPWIWGIAALYFPFATQIVDLYHAREHLSNLGKIVFGPATEKVREWTAARKTQLDEGDVDAVVLAMKRLRPRADKVREEICKAIDYFRTNKDRMRYAEFRRQVSLSVPVSSKPAASPSWGSGSSNPVCAGPLPALTPSLPSAVANSAEGGRNSGNPAPLADVRAASHPQICRAPPTKIGTNIENRGISGQTH